MIFINPYFFGATLSTSVNYEFNGTDGDTTTTDSTGNTTASGLGVVSGSSFAYIFYLFFNEPLFGISIGLVLAVSHPLGENGTPALSADLFETSL